MTSTARYTCEGCGQIFDGDGIPAFEHHVEQCLAGRSRCVECHKLLPRDSGPRVVRHAECCWIRKPKPKREWISVTALSTVAMGACLLVGPSTIFFPEKKWITFSLLVILLLSIIGFIVKGIRVHQNVLKQDE